jgi:hypothetical protein
MAKWEKIKDNFLDFNDRVQTLPEYREMKFYYDEVLDNNITVVFTIALKMIKTYEKTEEYEKCTDILRELKFLYSSYFDLRFDGRFQQQKESSFNELLKQLNEINDR